MRPIQVRFAMTAHLFLSALLTTSIAVADTVPDPEVKTVNGAREIWINTSDGSQKLGDVEVIPSGTTFYHWTHPDTFNRWVAHEKVENAEIDALKEGTGAVGGGFYVSTDSWDSNSFGPKLIVFTTTQDVTTLTNVRRPQIMKEAEWVKFNKKLEHLGIDGVGRYDNSPTWFNFLNDKPLLNLRVGTFRDLKTSEAIKTNNHSLFRLLKFNSRIPLQETPWVKTTFPMTSQIFDHSLDLSKLTPSDKEESLQWLIDSSTIEDQSPLTKGARALFKSEMTAKFRDSYAEEQRKAKEISSAILSNWAETGIKLKEKMLMSRRLEIPYSTWAPEVTQQPATFPFIELNPQTESETLKQPTLGYSSTIKHHLAYLDMDNFLSAIAQGKSIENIYDTSDKPPYSTRWALALSSDRHDQKGTLTFHRALTGNPQSDFRDSPASSDGDIIWQGKKYFQVNDEQSHALRKNPFITPEFQTIADPNHPGRTIQVARYDYPTAVDFEKFEDNLSFLLKKDLIAAKSAGKLNDPWAPETRVLTKQMLSDIATKITSNYMKLTPEDAHYALLSLHPFNEMNAETAAALGFLKNNLTKLFYKGNRTIPGKPDEALLMNRESFNALAIEDAVNTLAIQSGFARAEAESPKFPKYFDVPEIWQVGRKISNVGPDPAAFVQESKGIYSTCLTRSLDASLNHGGER